MRWERGTEGVRSGRAKPARVFNPQAGYKKRAPPVKRMPYLELWKLTLGGSLTSSFLNPPTLSWKPWAHADQDSPPEEGDGVSAA